MMRTTTYLIKKLSSLLLSLFFTITLTFVLMKAIPGDPFSNEQAVPEEILQSLHRHYGLDKPLYKQYGRYLLGVLRWDLGPSFKYEGRTVNDILRDGFPVSATLGLLALLLATIFGILFGSIAAFFRGKWPDRGIALFFALSMALPSFVLATLLQYIFGLKLGWLPIARWGTLSHIILPTITLAAFPTAFIAKLTRTHMIEVLEREYILTARAKGLSPFFIWKNHLCKNALLPTVSYLGTLTANILTGSFIVEKFFGIPGIGGWFVSSVLNRDYTIILGLTIFYSSLLMVTTFLADLLFLVLDPRIRSDGKGLPICLVVEK